MIDNMTLKEYPAYKDICEMLDGLENKYKDDHRWIMLKQLLDKAIDNNFQTTIGDYQEEKESSKHFDSLINPDFFYNEIEVRGRRLFDDKVKSDDSSQNVRIDRILHPTPKAFDSGWIWGPIAVEIKKSNMAIGPILAQILEYRQSVFLSKYLNNCRIMPIPFAIFPARGISHDLHSLQETQNILSCFYDSYNKSLKFNTYGKNALEINKDGISIGCWKANSTKGHRGHKK